MGESVCAPRRPGIKMHPRAGAAVRPCVEANYMPAEPNLSAAARVLYVALGLSLMAWGFWGTDTAWVRLLLPLIGAVLLVEGLIGFCVACAALGLGRKKG